jgi:SecD/SecF fusion protein
MFRIVVSVALVMSAVGCRHGPHNHHSAIRLKAARDITRQDLERSVQIMQNRIEKLGLSGVKVRGDGPAQIVVELPSARSTSAVMRLIWETGSLAFYDFEADLMGPSIRRSRPIPSSSLYELLSHPVTVALAAEGTPSSWYLFDAHEAVRAGPAPTKGALLATEAVRKTLRGTVPRTWHVLRVPANTTVASCELASGNCLGAQQPTTSMSVFYLLGHRVDTNHSIPEMTGKDLEPSGTRAEFDQNGQPIVTMQFTGKGKKVFHEITRHDAQRGSLLGSGGCDLGKVLRFAQHFAIVLDNRIESAPYIDYCKNPDGIPGDNGAEISLGQSSSIRETKRLAVLLQTGALPVRFGRVR